MTRVCPASDSICPDGMNCNMECAYDRAGDRVPRASTPLDDLLKACEPFVRAASQFDGPDTLHDNVELWQQRRVDYLTFGDLRALSSAYLRVKS